MSSILVALATNLLPGANRNEILNASHHDIPAGSGSTRGIPASLLFHLPYALQLSVRHILRTIRHLRGHRRCSNRCPGFNLRLLVNAPKLLSFRMRTCGMSAHTYHDSL